jgi:insulin-like growth factor 2 mRNA-binding protein 1
LRRGSVEDIRLTLEISIPSSQIGRIIGKGGASVKELQKVTGATVKFPEQGTTGSSLEAPVHIIGTFYASQVS